MSDRDQIQQQAQQIALSLVNKGIRVNVYLLDDASIGLEVLVFKDTILYLKIDPESDSPVMHYVETFPDECSIPVDLSSVRTWRKYSSLDDAVNDTVGEFIETFRERGKSNFEQVLTLVETAAEFQVSESPFPSSRIVINGYAEFAPSPQRWWGGRTLEELRQTMEATTEVQVDEYGQIHVPETSSLEATHQIVKGEGPGKVRPIRWFAGPAVDIPFVISRYINTTFPQDGQIGQVQILRVQICCRTDSDFSRYVHLVVSPEAQKTGEIPVDIYVRFDLRDFECDGPNVQCVAVPLDADSSPVIFKLIPKSEGLKTLTVEIYQHNSYVGEAQVQTVVGRLLEPARETHPGVPFNLLSHGTGPDLTLRVAAAGQRDGKQVYHFTLISCPDLNLYFHDGGETAFTRVPTAYLEEIRGELNEWANQGGAAALLNERLARVGADLYDQLFPEALKRLYWEELRERVRTLHIVSDEPWIPWELLKPWRRLPDGAIEEDEFVCERFALTRWLTGHFPTDILPLHRLSLLTDVALRYTDEEVDALRRFPGWEVHTVALTQAEIYRLLENGGFDGLHFACHGEYNPRNPDQSVLRLEDGFLRPSDISGRMQQFGRDRPLVFLNACEAAQQGVALTGLGGWARKFLEAGSGAFIGPTWEATSLSAKTFAVAFYRFFRQEGKPIAEAVRLAREAIREDGNPTWLSYAVYAHPMAQVQEVY